MASRLKIMSEEARVTVLTGARQVGKSTLLSHEMGAEWASYSLDDMDVRNQALRDPKGFLTVSKKIILDEAHLAPDLFPYIKQLVDEDRSRRFILSGSANLLLLAHASESLAGRAEFLRLLPLAAGELALHSPPSFLKEALEGDVEWPGHSLSEKGEKKPEEAVWRGGMPEVVYRSGAAGLTRWRDGYVRSYLEKDLRQLSQIDNLAEFKGLMSLAALRCGRLLNQSELARDAGLTQPTAHRYLGLLEVCEHCRRLPPFYSSPSKSIIKTPKLMWNDTGIAAFCVGYFSPPELLASREWGAFLECFVYNQLSAICGTWDPPGEIFFWRTRSGAEVDFVLRHGQQMLGIEVKAGSHIRFEDTIGLQAFMNEYPACRQGLVFHGGQEIRKLSDKITALPLSLIIS